MDYTVYTLNEKATEIVESKVMHFPTKELADNYRNLMARTFGEILMMEPIA